MRIHVTGAAGTGTTTLGAALSGRLRIPHFDSDTYFWIPTVPPYRIKRDKPQRDARLDEDIAAFDDWVWTGSAASWNIDFRRIDLIVYLTVPAEIRLRRLREREIAEHRVLPYVTAEESKKEIEEFMAWAARYDDGGPEVRSRHSHEQWMKNVARPTLRIDGDTTTEARVQRVLDALT